MWCDLMWAAQGTLPCLTESGDVVLETPDSVARAPDGNGGLYAALQRCCATCCCLEALLPVDDVSSWSCLPASG